MNLRTSERVKLSGGKKERKQVGEGGLEVGGVGYLSLPYCICDLVS